MYLLTVTFPLVLYVLKSAAQESPIIEIGQGRLRGRTFSDRKGGIIYSFQNIPFAKPPIGELRFRAPRYPEQWEGIREATEDLPSCIQLPTTGTTIIGQEDCLYLNVYTPELPQNGSRLKTVMVFIHGGAFTEGSAGQAVYGPEFLLPEGVILVATNYRLGILGGFSIDGEDLGVPGNAGMKDLVLALEWTQNNIRNFGGNPNDVTVFGVSAGASSVHLLVISPLAKGLFNRAIAQSGVAISGWTLGIPNNGLLLADYFNIPTDNLPDAINSLRNLSAEAIVRAQQNITANLPFQLGGISNPVIEKSANEPAFLSDDPVTLIRNGIYNNVSFFTGYNDAEGIYFGVGHLLEGFNISLNFLELIPSDLGIESGSQIALEVAEKIRYFYFGNSTPTIENIENTFQLYTDILFSFPAYRTAVEQVKTSNLPIYFYRFSADTSLNLCKVMFGVSDMFPGAAHCDELGYLFRNVLTPDILPDSVEDRAIERMVKFWTNFAKFGTPTPEDFTDFRWEPVTENTLNYVDIGTHQSTPGINPDYENIRFWSDLYATYSPPHI